MTARNAEAPDGRTLHVHEAGDPDGRMVVYQHGTPSDGQFLGAWVEDAERRGIRLVGYDRPGYAGSTRDPGRRVADAADDVLAIVAALGGGPFATWGISGGAPHALACASLGPGGLVAAAALAAPAPYGADGLDWFAGMGEGNIAEFRASLDGEETLRALLEEMRRGILGASAEDVREEMASVLSPLDFDVFSGEVGEFLGSALRAALGGGVDGWVDDDLAFVADWGFEPTRLQVPTLVAHGEHDLMVPPAHFRWLEARLPAEARFEREEGHLTLMARFVPTVHEWLLRHF